MSRNRSGPHFLVGAAVAPETLSHLLRPFGDPFITCCGF